MVRRLVYRFKQWTCKHEYKPRSTYVKPTENGYVAVIIEACTKCGKINM